MRRDRTGELLDDEDQAEPEPERHLCNGGWLGEDEQGRPRPCSSCKPHLRAGKSAEPAELPWSDGVSEVPDAQEVPEPVEGGSGTSESSGTPDVAVTSAVPPVPAVPVPTGASPLRRALAGERNA